MQAVVAQHSDVVMRAARVWTGNAKRLHALLVACVLFCCAACAAPSSRDALRIASGSPETATTLVYLVPGVLTSTSLFGPALDWGRGNTAVIEYRFPGFDGRPLQAPLRILAAAEDIALDAAAHPAKRVVLVGFSTGAAISIEAGARMPGKNVTVVGISSAVPFPGMILASAGAASDIAASGARSNATSYDAFWRDYHRTLLLGRSWPHSAKTRARADALMADYDTIIAKPPKPEMATAHASDLLIWRLTGPARASQARHVFWHGQNDTIAPLPSVRRLARDLDGTLFILGGLGHMTLEAEPDLIRVIGRSLKLE